MRKLSSRPMRIWLAALVLMSTHVVADEFRTMSRIPKPSGSGNADFPAPQLRLDLPPVTSDMVELAVHSIAGLWNTPQMDEVLAGGFIDADLLGDTISNLLPRDARLRVLSVNSFQTLSQSVERDDNDRAIVSSRVSVLVSTQIEYQSAQGLVRVPGVNEFIVRFDQFLPEGAQ